jgi:phosphoglycolate phosphatase
MLVLFDIDATLLLTYGAGVRSMQAAGCELYRPDFKIEGLACAGRLDLLIWRDLAELNGVNDADGELPRFIETYHRKLQEALTGPDDRSTALPGTTELIDRLRATDGVTLGLLTGNFEVTGRLKVSHVGIDLTPFEVSAWGTDGNHRSDLPPVAMQRYQMLKGRPISPDQCVIIGDTPHDVSCALDNGCRSLAVATGPFDTTELGEAGAHWAVEDLSNTDAIVDWVLGVTATT